MAKSANADAVAMQALAAMLADPAPRILHGSAKQPGVFAGANAVMKAAARLCLDFHWIEPTGQFTGKGKSQKELFRITAEGIKEVLQRSDPRELFATLTKRLEGLQEHSTQLPARVAELSNHAASLQHAIEQASEQLQVAIHHAEERLKPPDLEYLRQVLSETATAVPTAAPTAKAAWTDDALRFIAGQKQRHLFQRLTLPQLYQQLKADFPSLSLGEFHDGLRRLHEQGRIRLGPFTQALATLEDPRNALYLDREVKYYVELA